jgi:hypothetical protein
LLKDEIGLNPEKQGLAGISLPTRSKLLQHFSLVQSALTHPSMPTLQTTESTAVEAIEPLGIHLGGAGGHGRKDDDNTG